MKKGKKLFALVLSAILLMGTQSAVDAAGVKQTCGNKAVKIIKANCNKKANIKQKKKTKKKQKQKKKSKKTTKKTVTKTTNQTRENTMEKTVTTKEQEYVNRVVELVNNERAKAGLGKVTLNETLNNAAQLRAKESAVSFSHTRPNGTAFSTVLQEYSISYRGAGENIAWGQKTPEEVMNGWMNSPGHRANILNGSFTKIGVGFYQDWNGKNYWSQLFVY
ncbi:MAG: hypothetical protein K6G64_06835 [Eubacterium sp.]|nr:hypothetical protein [Eubacterium sp.]